MFCSKTIFYAIEMNREWSIKPSENNEKATISTIKIGWFKNETFKPILWIGLADSLKR